MGLESQNVRRQSDVPGAGDSLESMLLMYPYLKRWVDYLIEAASNKAMRADYRMEAELVLKDLRNFGKEVVEARRAKRVA